jgi:hypothetical protein
MAVVGVEHRLNLEAINELLRSPRGGVARDLLRRGLLVETQAKRNLGGVDGPKRVDTGRLRASINTQIIIHAGQPVCVVGTNVRYALWVHDGTGIYGPRHRMIKPRLRKRLRFKPRGSARYVYARAVRGIPPNRFLANALRAARR